ncbi:MAG: NAD-dependent epimerase/dehydratase family protein [Bacteroidales bacterium]|nr:NAD-dependent epimerase/dehydratase family protein [Bacteroidales bacterium]
MQTILGSGGIISHGLASELARYTDEIRLVSRNPVRVNPHDTLFPADLTLREPVMLAVRDSYTVYLTAGFPYSYKAWKTNWPVVMRNVIDACILHDAKLVFFDNIYMYDPSDMDNITEKAHINPQSRKGKVRKEIAQMIIDEVEKGRLTALIARAPDFYGPGNGKASILTEAVFKNLAQGKKANWLGSADCRHSFIYTPDAARATAMLGNADDVWNQLWHLPTAPDPLTGKEWIETIAYEMGVEPRYQAINSYIVKTMGIFIPFMRELDEMMYQYDRDYIFDSSKFMKRFNYIPTSYIEGIRNIIELNYSHIKYGSADLDYIAQFTPPAKG